jgi:hydroxyacylglutathione hydrolase
MKVNDEVYAYIWRDPRANNSNSFLIVSGQARCLIDPGHSAFLPGLFRQMSADGIRPEEITSVILTHGHPDHMEGGLELQKRGARLGMSRKEEAFLQEVGPYFAQMFGFRMPDLAFDFYLEEGALNVGSVEFDVLETPGHSPGSISLFRPADRMLFTGDLIFAQGVGRTDFPGGDSNLLKQSIRRCRELKPAAILSGHGEMILDEAEVERNFDMIERMYFPML